MQIYRKPELNILPFDVEDVITVSAGGYAPGYGEDDTDPSVPDVPQGPQGPDVENPNWAPAPIDAIMDADVQGAPNPIQQSELPFDTEVWGGNPIQEGLNALYENFVDRF